jgi:DHA1 family tetracycline resistance protein-like MFS transporter
MILPGMMRNQPDVPKATPMVLATVFIDIVGFGIILPLLPGTASRLGASPLEIGLLVASYSAVQFLLAPLWGRVSDRFGRRPVLLLGLAGSSLSYVVFALAGNWWVLLLSRILDGGSGATINVAQAYLADESLPAERAKSMGKIGAAVGMGFIVGPLIGGVTATAGNNLPAWIAAAVTGVNLLVALRLLPESNTQTEKPSAPQPDGPRLALPIPLLVLFMATLSFSVMYVVFPLWGEATLDADQSKVSYWFAFIGLVTVITQGGALGRLVRRWGETGTARSGAALLATGLALMPIAGDSGSIWFYAVLGLIGSGYGMAGPAMLGLISRHTGAASQGRILGIAQSTASLARIVGPILAGGVMGWIDAATAFTASAALAVVALGAVLTIRGKSFGTV